MIVKNEKDTLATSLGSVKDIVDEIIIVDTGSDDNTKQEALKFTNKIYDFQWVDDFSLARNYSFSKATKDYILWMDADDLILPEDRLKLISLKESLSSDIDAVMMKYNTGFDNQGKVLFSYYRERLAKRSRNSCSEMAKCYLMCGKEEKAVSTMLRSFIYDAPRAELCCQLGYYFKNKGKFKQAAFWFETALKLEKPQTWGFIQHDFWDYIPCIELAVCYDKLEDYGRAEAFNEIAAYYKPDSPG